MTWRALISLELSDILLRGGCHSTQETKVLDAFDDVASAIYQSLAYGGDFGDKPNDAQFCINGRAVQVDPGWPALAFSA
jgi:hypothetical protein